MKHRHTSRHPSRTRSMLVAGMATALALFIPVSPAQATDDDPHVILKGGAGCREFLYQPTSVQFVLDNGETASSAFNSGAYKVHFYNIAGPAPTYGNVGYATITCAKLGKPSQTYTWTRGVSVQRPRLGNQQSMSLGGG